MRVHAFRSQRLQYGGARLQRHLALARVAAQQHGDAPEFGGVTYDVAYRSVKGPANEWFIDATLAFDPDVTPSMDAMQVMLERRKTTQPLGLPSCGSVFRNPPGDHSARLIEAAGLKGHRIGGAEVSTKHANFIINRDDASATDIEALIEFVRRTVLDVHGVSLKHEVRIVGEAVQ